MCIFPDDLRSSEADELLVARRFGPAAGERAARIAGFLCAGLLCGGLVWLMRESRGNLWLALPLRAAGGVSSGAAGRGIPRPAVLYHSIKAARK
ncbi:hypothetical protein [Oscillibacter sp.]|uniref:hypothetical protein n=1 Tax=Oscillibacter sp. TaxID=1945593 RepID=UPI002898B41F|nr:hypothetical protein [Oscillibacter sp.]